MMYVLSQPNPDWSLVAICHTQPGLEVNDLAVVSTFQDLNKMPTDVEQEFRKISSKLGLDFDRLCTVDFSSCNFDTETISKEEL